MNSVWLKATLTKEEYNRTIAHIHNAMFFAIRRVAPNLRHIVLHSIGDEIDVTDADWPKKAEVFLEKKIEDNSITTEALTSIIKGPVWHVKFCCYDDNSLFYSIIVEKKTDLIVEREFSTPILYEE